MSKENLIFSDDTDLSEVGFSAHIFNVLSRAGVRTVGDAKKMSDVELLNLRNVSYKNLDEIDRLIPDRDRGIFTAENNYKVTPPKIITMWESGLSIDQIHNRSGVSEFDIENILEQRAYALSANKANRQDHDSSDTLICNMELSIQLVRVLYRNDIFTERDIRAKSDEYILRLKWLRKKHIEEIHTLMPDRIRTIKCHGKEDKERLADILNMRKSGITVADISEKYKITSERVNCILKTAGVN